MITKPLVLTRKEWASQATLFQADLSLDEVKTIAPHWLHPEEITCAQNFSSPSRQHSYLLGRFCAKKAIQSHLNHPNICDIQVKKGVFSQPLLSGPGTHDSQISLAHSQHLGIALVFPTGHLMGVDIEKINPKREAALKKNFTPQELLLVSESSTGNFDRLTLLTWIWTAKEALGKALCTGLTVPFSVYEVQDIQIKKGLITATYKNFRQYKVVSYLWQEAVISIALPRHTQLSSLEFL